jgi:hypothetical protein
MLNTVTDTNANSVASTLHRSRRESTLVVSSLTVLLRVLGRFDYAVGARDPAGRLP